MKAKDIGEYVPFSMCLTAIKWNCLQLDASPGQYCFNLRGSMLCIKKMMLDIFTCYWYLSAVINAEKK